METVEQTNSTILPKAKASPLPAMLLALGFVSLCFLVQQIFLPSFYQNNDDVGRLVVAAGQWWSDVPDEHLLVVNILAGILLKHLYSATPAIPWYVVGLFASHILSAATIVFVFLQVKKNKLEALLAGFAFFVCAWLFVLVNLQFTSTSLLSGLAAGVLLCWSASDPDLNRAQRLGYSGFAGLLYLIAIVIRSGSACFALGLSVMLMVCFIQKIKHKKAVLACLAGSGIVLLALQFFNTQYYMSDAKWAQYYASREALVKLIDCSGVDRKRFEFKDGSSWSENDVMSLQAFLYVDPQVFSTERMIEAYKAAPLMRADISPTYLQFAFSAVLSDLSIYPPLLLVLPAFFLKPRWGSRKSLLLYTIASFAVVSGVITFGKIAPHVYYSVFLSAALAALLCCGNEPDSAGGGIKKTAFMTAFVLSLVAVIAGTLIVTNNTIVKPCRIALRKHKELVKTLDFFRSKKGNLFFIMANGFPLRCISPYDQLNVLLSGIEIVPTGGYNNSPLIKSKMERLGLKGDLFKACFNDNMLVVSSDYLNGIFAKYVQEHYHAELLIEKVYENPELPLQLYRYHMGSKGF